MVNSGQTIVRKQSILRKGKSNCNKKGNEKVGQVLYIHTNISTYRYRERNSKREREIVCTEQRRRGFLVASRERLLEDQTFTVKPSGSPFCRPLDCSISSALYLYGLVAVHWKGGRKQGLFRSGHLVS